MDSRTVGILGGGQLGRMLVAAASLLNVNVVILDSGEHGPAKQIVASPPSNPHLAHIDGSFTDEAKIRQLASRSQVLTVEIEHVNADVLEEVQKSLGIEVNPSPQTIRLIQDKYLQKLHLQSHGIPVAESIEVDSSVEGIQIAATFLGLPLMLKSKTLAYDGRGNFVVTNLSQAQAALHALGNRPLYAERLVNLSKELAVMVVRSTTGETRSYPVVETVHKDNICHLVFAPARTSKPGILRLARELAEKTVMSLSGAGVFGVEMFLLQDGTSFSRSPSEIAPANNGIETLLINEIAPRPHNSGHYTIEACNTSQYENHLRAILSLPLGSTDMKVPSAAMLNLLGFSSSMDEIHKVARKALSIPGASVHLYGKSECRKGRKMGHITLVANSDSDIRQNLHPLLSLLPDSTPESVKKFAPTSPAPRSGVSSENPLVGIIMGSDSDLPVMIAAARILDDFNVPYELSIVSAHRTPDRMHDYAKSAVSRGLRVLIAGAGGAAHLPGMVASMTALPVIGVPVKGSSLDGVDSLYSIVQMPRGIPVATVAINNSTNAALLAIRILGSQIPELCNAVEKYSGSLQNQVLDKIDRLESIGWEAYINPK